VTRFVGQLHSAGMSPADAQARSAIFENLLRELRALDDGPMDRPCAFFVPGRIEVLGKHTDYAGGRSLLCAVERGICLAAAPRADAQIHVIDAARNLETRFAFEPRQEISSGHWSSYAVTVARRIARDFPAARTGAEIMFSSDLPRASGISSSSALVIAIFSALAEINSLSQIDAYQRVIRTCEDLAGYLAAVENGFEFASFSGDSGVGTLGGSEDHTAILCCRVEHLRQYSFCPTRLEREIRMPERHSFVIAASGVEADKIGAARDSYNRCSLAARKIFALWRAATKRDDASLGAVLTFGASSRERLFQIISESADAEFPPEVLLKRLAQFVEESAEIIPAASQASREEICRLLANSLTVPNPSRKLIWVIKFPRPSNSLARPAPWVLLRLRHSAPDSEAASGRSFLRRAQKNSVMPGPRTITQNIRTDPTQANFSFLALVRDEFSYIANCFSRGARERERQIRRARNFEIANTTHSPRFPE
jgi:galactokinase